MVSASAAAAVVTVLLWVGEFLVSQPEPAEARTR